MARYIPVGLYLAVLFVSANVAALSGQGDSAVGTLDTVLPEFSNLVVIPPEAVSGEVVTLTFTASSRLLKTRWYKSTAAMQPISAIPAASRLSTNIPLR